MPQQGKFTKETACKQGLIECPPIRRALNKWLDEQWAQSGMQREEGDRRANQFDGGSPIDGLAARTGITADLLYRISARDKDWVEFDTADKIVCCTVGTWDSDPELHEIYQSYDFTWLDLARPPVPDADGILSLHAAGVRPGLLAKLCGVEVSVIFRALKGQREALVSVANGGMEALGA